MEMGDYFKEGLRKAKPIIDGYFKKRDIKHPVEVAEILSIIEKGNAFNLSTDILYSLWEAVAQSPIRQPELIKLREILYSIWEYKMFTK